MNKLKLVRVNVNRNYLWAFRIVIFLASTPFLLDLYHVLVTGIIQDGRTTATHENGKLFYLIIIKKMAYAMLLLWFCTGGLVAKKEGLEGVESDEKSES